MKRRQSMKQKEVKTGLVKAVLGKRPLKSRGVGSREVRISFRGKIIKMASQRQNERALTIYIEQMLYLQKLIFNIRARREVRNDTQGPQKYPHYRRDMALKLPQYFYLLMGRPFGRYFQVRSL